MTCSTALAAAVGAAHEDHAPGTGPADETYGGDITATATGIVIAAGVALGPNTPDAHGMHLTTGTEVYADDTGGHTSSFEHPTWAVGYEAGVVAGDYHSEVTWRSGNTSNNAVALCQAFIPTVATAPTQESHGKYPGSTSGKRTLGSDPAVGAAIVMVVTRRSGSPFTAGQLWPVGGWTELALGDAYHSTPGSGDAVGIYMRCVEEGDGRTYGIQGSGSSSHSVTVMEWPILDAPPPPPIVPRGEFAIDGVRFERLLEAKVRVEFNSAGEGHFVISKGDPQATPTLLYRGARVLCTFPEIDPDPIFEFFLTEGDFDVVSGQEEGGEELSFGGSGTLSMLRRAVVREVEYLDGIGYPKPKRGVWLFDEDNTEGHIVNKLVREAQAPARPAHPLQGVTKTFDATTDTDGVTWADQTLKGNWKVKIGSNLYDAVMRLVNSGLLNIEMAPGLELNLWRSRGRDLSGNSYGEGVIIFAKGVNIVTDLSKDMAGQVFATHALVKFDGGDGYTNATKDAGDFSYDVEAYIETEANHADTAKRQAKHSMKLRELAQDAIEFAHKVPWPGRDTDWEAGLYLPGPRWSERGMYWVGDLVTLLTGTSTNIFDFFKATKQVYAITLYMDATGYLAPPVVELNAPYKRRKSSRSTGYSGSLSDTGTGGGSGGGSSGGGSAPLPIIIGGSYQPLAEKGADDGYAGLNGSGHVPADQLGSGAELDGLTFVNDLGQWVPYDAAWVPVWTVTDSTAWDGVVDLSASREWDVTLTDDLAAYTIVPPASLVAGRKGKWQLTVRQDATGGHDILAHAAEVFWPDSGGVAGGAPPAINMDPFAVTVLVFQSHDGAVTWGGSYDGSGGGGGSIELQEGGVTRTATMTTLNVRHGLDADASGNVDVDEAELDHANLANLGSGDPHTQYALESAIVPAAGPDADVTVDAAGAAGSAGTYARSGHGHKLTTTAGPGADTTIDAAGAAGATGAAARAGHGHKLVTSSATPAAAGPGAAGTSGTAPSRGDHQHPHVGQWTPFVSGLGGVVPAGEFIEWTAEFAGTLTGWHIDADVSGSIQFDIWKKANALPSVADTITAAAKPLLSSAQRGGSTSLTGWTTAFAAGDVFRLKVDSATTISWATLALKYTRA